jgi:cysteinyl-tRNA synthetase
MTLSLYDTLSQQKKPFTPQDPRNVRMYVCGPTVYDHPHIGHARCYLVYDVLVRHLRTDGFQVCYVRNITDIDDKIVAKAQSLNWTTRQVTETYTASFHEAMRALGLIEPNVEPKVSDHLQEIIDMIQTLIDRGAAYEADGDVYFRVESFAEYGKLSHRTRDAVRQGASGRVDQDEPGLKERPEDFALWKRDRTAQQAGGQPTSWPSPWGQGRPGWHIECSAMSTRHLGPTLDVHGGGLDLVFPHHENEIAQSETATGKPFANVWMHNGFVEVNKQKMSKSLGNFFSLSELFRFVVPEALRYYALTVHYRSPLQLDWTTDAEGKVTGFPQIQEAERRVEYLYQTKQKLLRDRHGSSQRSPQGPEHAGQRPSQDSALDRTLERCAPELRAALDDDLNTPAALAVVHEFVRAVNDALDQASKQKRALAEEVRTQAEQGFAQITSRLGLAGEEPGAMLTAMYRLRAEQRNIDCQQIEQKVAERNHARQTRDFARADAIRAELRGWGVELMDSGADTTWRIE